MTTTLQTLRPNLMRILPAIVLVVAALFLVQTGYAQITSPTLPDGSAASDNFIGDMGKIIKGMFQIGIYALLAAGWLVAGYLIITSAMAILDKKGGVGTFFLGVGIAFVMVLATTYFLDKGEDALDDIGTTYLYAPVTEIALS